MFVNKDFLTAIRSFCHNFWMTKKNKDSIYVLFLCGIAGDTSSLFFLKVQKKLKILCLF